MWDIAEQMERDAGVAPGVLDMFVIERLHLKVKQHVRTLTNTTAMEKTVRPFFHLACGFNWYMLVSFAKPREASKTTAREAWDTSDGLWSMHVKLSSKWTDTVQLCHARLGAEINDSREHGSEVYVG